MNMKEIEKKYQIEDNDKFIQKLEGFGCEISEVNHQKDSIYVSDIHHIENTPGSLFLRVRKDNDKIELNAKKHEKVMEARTEVEFEVSSYENANHFLEFIGFEKWVEVRKKRVHTFYKDCNICIDEVEELGSFVELEYVVEDDVLEEEILKKIDDIAKELGIDTIKEVHQYYDEMITERNA